MHKDRSFNNLDPETGDLFLERRRGRSRLWLILVAMPRAGDATIDNAPFSERSVLMLASIRDRGDLAIVAEDRNALAGERYDRRAFLGDTIHSADLNETFVDRVMSRPVHPLLPKRRREMKREYCSHSHDEGSGQHGT